MRRAHPLAASAAMLVAALACSRPASSPGNTQAASTAWSASSPSSPPAPSAQVAALPPLTRLEAERTPSGGERVFARVEGGERSLLTEAEPPYLCQVVLRARAPSGTGEGLIPTLMCGPDIQRQLEPQWRLPRPLPQLELPSEVCPDSPPAARALVIELVNVEQSVVLRIPELGVSTRVIGLDRIHCDTIVVPQARMMELGCSGSSFFHKQVVVSIEGRLLTFQSQEESQDEGVPVVDRWVVELPCGRKPVLRGGRFFDPAWPELRTCRRACSSPFNDCRQRCRVRHMNAQGELSEAGNACERSCVDQLTRCQSRCR